MPGRFKIHIGVSGPEVEVSGSDEAVINNREMAAFEMTEDNLIDAIEAYFGNRPNQVFVKDPTNWGNTYDKFDWDEVHRILVARAGHPVVNTETFVVAEHTFNNPSSTLTAKCNVGLTQQVEETFTSSWSKSKSFAVEKQVTYDLNFLGNGVGGTAGFTFTNNWGEDVSKSNSVNLGVTCGMEVELAPGQKARTILTARRGTLNVIIHYDATLKGHVFGNHNPKFKNHHFWAHDVNSILEAGHLPTSVVIKQKINIGFYTDVEMTVVDPDQHNLMLRWPRL